GREAELFATICGLTQLVEKPTRIPDRDGEFASLLDLVLASDPDSYTVSVHALLGTSDHKLITVSCQLKVKTQDPPMPRKVWHYKSAEWNHLREFYRSFPWKEVCFRTNNISECANQITETILAGMEAYIPFSTKCGSNNKQWFNLNCKNAVNTKNAAYRKLRQHPSIENRRNFLAFRNSCKRIIDECKESHNNRIKNKLLNCLNGTRSFWSVSKAVSQGFAKSALPPLTADDGSIAVTAREKANLLGKLFASNSTLHSQGKTPPYLPRVNSSMGEISFPQRIINKILKSVDTNKASGPDRTLIQSTALRTIAHLFPHLSPPKQRQPQVLRILGSNK
ncbi:uncharacterized protein LOC126737434, partial [Anthonomus grandis grandis]|uniref:uncharacterized protein LOC126737434 n=1 Tax=Anthonomus grandis grandis TaxID=2921223 RepID=UPI002166A64C